MGESIHRLLRGQIVASVFYIALGLLLALMPVESISILCKIVFGIVLMAAGVYHVAIHLLEWDNATVLDLFSGVLMIILGVFLFKNPLVIVKLLPVLIGALILVDSLWNLKGVWKLRKNRRSTWRTLFLGCLVFIALGVALIMNPFTVVKDTIIFAGCILVCCGLVDLLYMGLVRYGLKKAEEERKVLESVVVEEDAVFEEEAPETPLYADWNSHVRDMEAESQNVETEVEIVETEPQEDVNE